MNPYKYLLKNLSHLSKGYQKLVVRTYMEVIIQVFLNAKLPLLKGIFYSFINVEKKEKAFLEGSKIWGNGIIKITKTNLHIYGETKIPDNGHMIFINHVNELDFPFDCFVIKKPYLANQSIKSSYFAYWWMKAMGSEVFDTTHARTISSSLKNLIKGIKTRCYIVYPEGHNTYSEEIKVLKKGMVKLAFENKIPIFLILKSGVAKLQEVQKGNHIGYRFSGVINPADFQKWEELKEFVYNKMKEEKKILDDDLEKV